jgi:MFS family permease
MLELSQKREFPGGLQVHLHLVQNKRVSKKIFYKPVHFRSNMISRTATKVGTEIAVDRASVSVFHDQLEATKQEVQHKLRFRFLGVVALALFCDFLLLSLCVPILPAMFGDTYSNFEIGLIFASKPFFQFLANPYMGSLVDKYGPKYPLLFGVFVLAVSTCFFAIGLTFTHNLSVAYAVCMIARSVQGIASASTMSAGMTLAALTHHESNRGTAMGIAMIGVALGTLMGPPIGGIMGYFISLWSPYIAVAGLLFCNCVAQLYILHRPNSTIPVYIKEKDEPLSTSIPRASFSSSLFSENGNNVSRETWGNGQPPDVSSSNHPRGSNSRHNSHSHSISSNNNNNSGINSRGASFSEAVVEVITVFTLLRNRQILFVGVVAVLGNCCVGMIEPLVPLYLDAQFGENVLHQGLIFSTATISYLIATPFAGMLSDAYPKWACLTGGLLSVGFGFLFLYDSTSLVKVCVSLFFIGAGMGFLDTPILPLLSEIIEVRCRYLPIALATYCRFLLCFTVFYCVLLCFTVFYCLC